MKKLLTIVIASILLVCGMAMTVGAAEYVYYENDFSDPKTLSDFTQYRGEWDIVDGQLMLVGMGDVDDLSKFAFMLYTADPAVMNLTDYIAEVDLTNTQSAAALLSRCDITQAQGETADGWYGYMAFLSNNGTLSAFGRGNGLGAYAGNLHVSSAVTAPGSNLHLKATYQGTHITYVMSDLNTGSELYTIELDNDEWAYGSFGFRAAIMQSGLTNLGVLGFDNLKITAIGEVGDWLAAGKSLADYKPSVTSNVIVPKVTEAIEVTVPEVVKVEASKLDVTKTEYVFYENDFSDPATIADFTQYRGDWTIKDGRLYYSAVTTGFEATSNFAFILYSGNHDANLLQNYTLEVDVYNSQTSSGVITHADLSQADSDTANSFYGYVSFISNDGTKGATGYCDWQGAWGGNLAVGEPLLNPGGNYHIKVECADGMMIYTITAVGSDDVIWTDTQVAAEWPAGSFGFRMRVAMDSLVSLDNTAYDNLKVTVYGEEAVLLNAGYHPNAEIVGTLDLPAESTAAPVETTAAPAETTVAPVVTTEAPAVTTATPVVTTAALAVTTTAPVATTEAPVVTTAAPVVATTAAPETTEAPVATTAAPATTTDAPVTTVAPAPTQTEGGVNVGLIVGIVIAVVAAVVIVAVVSKKKKN
ncbi:MAG: hypothetical protein IJX64_07010 [Clostridia bacterium]|nr:hypothetical protein [Clostridia bacterium]